MSPQGFAALLYAGTARQPDAAEPDLSLNTVLELTATVPGRLVARPPVVSAVIAFDGAAGDSTATPAEEAAPPGVSELLAAVAPPVANSRVVEAGIDTVPLPAPGGLRELLVSGALEQPPVFPAGAEPIREVPASPTVPAMLEAAAQASVDPPGEPGSTATGSPPLVLQIALPAATGHDPQPDGTQPESGDPDRETAASRLARASVVPQTNAAPSQPAPFAVPSSKLEAASSDSDPARAAPPTAPVSAVSATPSQTAVSAAHAASISLPRELQPLPAAAAQDRDTGQPTQPAAPDGPEAPANLPSSGTSRSTPATSTSRPATLAPQLNPAEFVERLAQTFLEAHRAGRPLHVRLHPPELGLLQIELSRRDGLLTARLDVETAAARQTILDQLPQLRESLVQTGSRIERIEVHLLERDDRPPHDGAGRRQSSEHPADDHPRRHASAHHRTDDDRDAPLPRPHVRQTALERLDIQI